MKNTWKERVKESWLINFFKKRTKDSEPAPRESQNVFLERTIENWLMSVNELTYQFSFYQILLSEGYEIIYNSKHNAFEQGKDIVAKKGGNVFAYQLKGGDISNSVWRGGVKAECEELVEYPIINPAISRNTRHKSFLVTNGEIEDTVRLAIDSLNSDKWKENPLNTITKGQLLSRLIKISNDFTPKSPTDYRDFLDLYLTDGQGSLDIPKYTKFISEILQIDNEDVYREERKRNIATASIYTGYIISSFEKYNNHVATIQTLTVLSSYIFALVEKFNLKEKYWLGSYVVIRDKIKEASGMLETEIVDGGFDKMINSIFDGEIGSYRRSLAVSYLLTYKISQILDDDKDCLDIFTVKYFKSITGSLLAWGESALYAFILFFILSIKHEDNSDSYFFLESALKSLIDNNGRQGISGLFSPYFKIDDVIMNNLGLLEEPIEESFVGGSYLIKSIISLLVRHQKKELVSKYWREITYISQLSFKPSKAWQNFIWHCKEGGNTSVFPKQTQSWAELMKEEESWDNKNVPKLLQKYYSFLPYYLLVFPHRINDDNIRFLEDKTLGKK